MCNVNTKAIPPVVLVKPINKQINKLTNIRFHLPMYSIANKADMNCNRSMVSL